MNYNLIALLFLTCAHIPFYAAELYNRQEAQSLLGYDPRITLIKERDSRVVKSGRKTVYFHGFGGSKDAASGVKSHYGSERLPGDVITFDFPDANYGTMDTSQSSLGQWNDIKTALYVLKRLHDAGEKEIGITAHSRGGATAVNMVAVLADQAGRYDNHLAELGIDNATRISILGMLQKGHIVLECPLVDVRAVIQNQIEHASFSLFGTWFASSSVADASTYSSATSMDYAAPAFLQKYRPWAEQARISARAWNGVNIPTIVHFQEEDEVLGNRYDSKFFDTLRASNGADTHLHTGRDGGHNSSFQSFAFSRNDFLQAYNGSHKPASR